MPAVIDEQGTHAIDENRNRIPAKLVSISVKEDGRPIGEMHDENGLLLPIDITTGLPDINPIRQLHSLFGLPVVVGLSEVKHQNWLKELFMKVKNFRRSKE